MDHLFNTFDDFNLNGDVFKYGSLTYTRVSNETVNNQQ